MTPESFSNFVTPVMNTEHLKNDLAVSIWGIINFTLGVSYLVYFIYKKTYKKIENE